MSRRRRPPYISLDAGDYSRPRASRSARPLSLFFFSLSVEASQTYLGNAPRHGKLPPSATCPLRLPAPLLSSTPLLQRFPAVPTAGRGGGRERAKGLHDLCTGRFTSSSLDQGLALVLGGQTDITDPTVPGVPCRCTACVGRDAEQ